jgi:hypothetical protein
MGHVIRCPNLGKDESCAFSMKHQWVVGAIFLGLKQMGLESDHSTPFNGEFKNEWGYTSVPAWCVQEKFTYHD